MTEGSHHKQHEIEQTDVDNMMIDYISDLPDCILHHILSFLPTKEAVKASILSKRWKTMWVSVLNLDFDDNYRVWFSDPTEEVDYQHLLSFMNFVERILSLRDPSKIDKFRLSCLVFFDPSRISSWISNAIMHNVQELDLSFFSKDPYVLPQSLFDCKSLVTLKLETHCETEISSHISLPCLKSLHLSSFLFPDDDSIEKLFSSCPVLEELVLLYCIFWDLKNVNISNSTLKRLTIHDVPGYTYGYLPTDCKIKIDANNLTNLEYIGDLSSEIFLHSVPSLVKAIIHNPYLREYDAEHACFSVHLLNRLQNVVFLKVSNCIMGCLVSAGSKMDPFPVFSNLTHLVLTTRIWNGSFMRFFNFFPTLQSIELSEGIEHCTDLGENGLMCLSAPLCISYHLKTLTLNNFYANDSEICFLKCILKYARVLEKMDVSWCTTEPRDMKKRRDVRKELETVEKSSAACIIKFL